MCAALDRLAPSVLDEWHVVGALGEIAAAGGKRTCLLGQPIQIDVGDDGTVRARRPDHGPLRAIARFGYAWVSLGDPAHGLFEIPEYAEPDRRNINAATFGVRVSAPRAVENFLDMAHFPFVHTDILGDEAHSEVKDYDVEISADPAEVRATRCRFYQPKAAASAGGGAEVEYVYRVPHPYCAVLYKSNPLDQGRMDVIALFGQPVDEEEVEANLLLSLIDRSTSDTRLRAFQQLIFAQDKPILENQVPKRLPLDPRAETPIRADKSSIAYRRWLRQTGVNFGTLPA